MPSPTLPDQDGSKGCAPPFGTALSPSGSSRKGVSPASPLQSTGATIADVLNRAADLITPEGAWTRGAGARDAQGKMVLPCSKRATCWCMEGAIAAVTRHDWLSEAFAREPAFRFLCDLMRANGFPGSVYRWNDTLATKAEVVAKLREAAAKALEQGK